VREALTSALSARDAIEHARVVDLFAGSGALGFEMLSRGASQVLFVERDARVAEHIRKSAQELAVEASVRVLREDILKPRGQRAILAHGPFDLVLADPPYREAPQAVQALTELCQGGLLAEGAVLLLEHAAKGQLNLPEAFAVLSSYRYGDTAVEIFTWGASP
jgi:16S rRNA (guanine966-N2)-methyltransferase